jgi:hypothetical protein
MPDRLLRRRITLSDGRELRTVSDALSVIETISDAECPTLQAATEQLFTAADTGRRADIRDATDQLETVLKAQRLL